MTMITGLYTPSFWTLNHLIFGIGSRVTGIGIGCGKFKVWPIFQGLHRNFVFPFFKWCDRLWKAVNDDHCIFIGLLRTTWINWGSGQDGHPWSWVTLMDAFNVPSQANRSLSGGWHTGSNPSPLGNWVDWRCIKFSAYPGLLGFFILAAPFFAVCCRS